MVNNVWMFWEDSIDLAASTVAGSAQPNLVIQLARTVKTPLGSAPAGLIYFHPLDQDRPLFMAALCDRAEIGSYITTQVFAHTPFDQFPTLPAEISIDTTNFPKAVISIARIPGFEIILELEKIGALATVHREIGEPMPFSQQGLEAAATSASFQLNGESIPIYLLPPEKAGCSAIWTPISIYAR
jgi:hypothetical protein